MDRTSGAPVSARDGGRNRDSRHAGARGVVAKHARPTGGSALCRPHWFTRRERKETPRERAGPLGQYPGPTRHDSIGVAVPSTPEEQRLDEVVSIPHREGPGFGRSLQSHDRELGSAPGGSVAGAAPWEGPHRQELMLEVATSPLASEKTHMLFHALFAVRRPLGRFRVRINQLRLSKVSQDIVDLTSQLLA